MKALAWLRGGSEAQELVAIGVVACGSPKAPGWQNVNGGWCRAQDVRAMVRGWEYAYSYVRYPDKVVQDAVQRPTCPECQVLLDQALEVTKQGSVPDQKTDATKDLYEAYEEHQQDGYDPF